MKIVIVGAGAMGGLFGALLHEGGLDVWLLDINMEHVAAVNKAGLIIEERNGSRKVEVKATTSPSSIGRADLAIIFVKSYATAAAAEIAARLVGADGHVLTLQNGLGNAEVIEKFVRAEQIIAGTTSHGATLLGPGRILHAGRGPTIIGPWVDIPVAVKQAEDMAALFTRCGIETTAVKDIRPVLWNKLFINVGINAITALTGIKNGQLLDLEVTRDISRAAVVEAVEVARRRGVEVADHVVKKVFEVARATGGNRSSMGQDVDWRRPTEIQAINGFVVKEARSLGLKTPVNETLYALVKTLEHHYLPGR